MIVFRTAKHELGFDLKSRSDHDRIKEAIELFNNTRGELMSNISELKTAVTEQTEAINSMQTRVQEDVAALQTKITELGADDPEVARLLESIRSNTQSINSLDPVAAQVPDSEEVPADADAGPVSDAPADAPGDAATDTPATDTPAPGAEEQIGPDDSNSSEGK